MVRLLVVGQSEIELDGKRLTTESEIVFGMLLYLAARAGDMVSREEAQALFWPEHSHTRGRHCLRQALYRLRQLGVPLRSDNGSFGIALGDVNTDYAGLTADDASSSTYRDVAIGEILPGYQPLFATPFAAWVEEFRSRIGLRMRQSLVRTIITLRSKGRYREAEPLARACLTADPYNEIATLTLAEATAVLSGNRAEAMAILDRYMDELEIAGDKRVTLSASILRRRISERFVQQRYAAPPEPPFVGRGDVLEMMVEKVQEAVAGRSTVVYLWGEPGLGKTRLIDELVKIAHVQDVRIERYGISPNDTDRPLGVFSALLPRLMDMRGAAGISPESHDAIRRFVDPAEWENLEPPRGTAEAWRTFSRLRTGLCELFEALADERPLVLAIDDVHWIDNRSLEVLAELVERVRRRVVLVLTSRESAIDRRKGPLAALCSRAAVRRLEGLGDLDVESLLSQIAVQRNLLLTRDFVRRIIAASAGNPLFVSELTTHYAWNGLGDDLPHNLQTLLQRRLEVLSSEALLVFQTCGVLGEHATVEQMGHVLQIPTHCLLRALAELESKSLFSVEPSRVVCRHELLRKEALAKLTPLARQALYRKAALVLETAALQEMSTTMGWHAIHAWLDAAQPSRALRLVTRMAGRLLSAGLAQDADALLEKARGVMHDVPIVMDLLPLQLRAAWARGDLRRSLDLALECQRLSHEMPTRLRDAHRAELAAFDASRGLEAMRPRLDLDLHRIETAVEPPNDLVELALRIVIAADDCLDPGMAQECFALLNRRRILERTRFDRKVIFQLVYHSHFGDLEFAVDRARLITAPNNRRRKQDLSTKARRLRWAHRPLLISGLFEEAISALDQSIAAGRNCGSILDEVASRSYRIETLLAANRLDEAQQTMAEIDAQATSDCGQLVQTTVFGTRAELLFALGRLDELHEIMCIIDSDVQPREHTRTRLGIDSLHLLHALARGRDIDDCRVSRILESWPAMRRMGAADTVFLALLGALLLRGDTERARAACLDYSQSRRERWPIPEPILRQFGAVLWRRGVEAPGELERFRAS